MLKNLAEDYYNPGNKPEDDKSRAKQISGTPGRSILKNISDFYNGRTSGETDSTKVNDALLRWQMKKNVYSNTMLQDNWDFRGKSAREERALTKNFIKNDLKKFEDSAKDSDEIWRKTHNKEATNRVDERRWKKVREDADKYMRNVARIRLKSMGYDVTEKAVDNLVSKDWFKNSLWIPNTLSYLGVDGVNSSPYGDMKFR